MEPCPLASAAQAAPTVSPNDLFVPEEEPPERACTQVFGEPGGGQWKLGAAWALLVGQNQTTKMDTTFLGAAEAALLLA